MIEFVVYIVIIILYFIFGGNRMRLNRINSFDFEYLSLDYNPLEEMRSGYDLTLKTYYKSNEPKLYLINKYCEAKLMKSRNGEVSFYVKERTTRNKQGRYFEVAGNSTHAYTMWGMIDMEFNELTRFQDIQDLYRKLNGGYYARGGMAYYREPWFRKLPNPIKNESAQNEYCRMNIKRLSDGKMALVCSEIWGNKEYLDTKEFVITAGKYVLFDILEEFSKEKDKMQDYLTLLAKYAKRTDIKIKEIVKRQYEEKVVPEQKINQPEQSYKPEEIQYLQVNIDTTPSEEYEKQKKKHIKLEPDEAVERISEKPEGQNKKYDERNLDL